MTIILYNCDAIFRLLFSTIILYVFDAVQNENLSLAYGLTALMVVVWYLSQLMRQSAYVETYFLASNIKAAIAMLLYTKISKLTAYVIKSSELGKITNLLSNDLSIIETRLVTVMWSTAFPVAFLGITILLLVRIGWVAIIGLIIVLLQIPISNMISKKNGSIIKEANEFKDKRVQITT